ncbi:MAG: hypothetical protein AABY83_10585 [Pseudomonadota bacterium]
MDKSAKLAELEEKTPGTRASSPQSGQDGRAPASDEAAALDKDIHGEMDRISQTLTQRVKELAERYETPLPRMVGRVAELEAKVNQHLAKMGFAW